MEKFKSICFIMLKSPRKKWLLIYIFKNVYQPQDQNNSFIYVI